MPERLWVWPISSYRAKAVRWCTLIVIWKLHLTSWLRLLWGQEIILLLCHCYQMSKTQPFAMVPAWCQWKLCYLKMLWQVKPKCREVEQRECAMPRWRAEIAAWMRLFGILCLRTWPRLPRMESIALIGWCWFLKALASSNWLRAPEV